MFKIFEIDRTVTLKDENVVRDDLLKIDDFINLNNLYFILNILNYRLYEREFKARCYLNTVLGQIDHHIMYEHDYDSLDDILQSIWLKVKEEKQHKKGYNHYFKYVTVTHKMRRLLKDDKIVKQIIEFTLNEIKFTVDDRRKKEKLEKFLHYLLTNK